MKKALIILTLLMVTGCGKHWVVTDRSDPANANYWTLQDAINNRESYIVPTTPQAAVVHEQQQQPTTAMQDEEKHDEHKKNEEHVKEHEDD